MSDQKWSVGQDVVVIQPYGMGKRIATVTRVLKQYVEVDGTKYNLDGHARGGGAWASSMIRATTPEEAAKVREEQERERLADRVRCANFRTLSLDQLRRIDAIVKEGP